MTELTIENYKVRNTGADGGHNYILTEIDYKGKHRTLVILFSDKLEEPILNENKPLKVVGEIKDDGMEFELMMNNARIEI